MLLNTQDAEPAQLPNANAFDDAALALPQIVEGSVPGAMRAIGASRQDVFMVPPTQIRVMPGFNVRERNEAHAQHIRSLADSMLSEGFFPDKPLSGYASKEGGLHVIHIYDGHCRLEAALLAISEGAAIEMVPVVMARAGLSISDMTVALVRTNSGRPLEPLETAMVCKRLVRYGLDDAEIVKRLGFTLTYYKDLMLLADSPEGIRQMVSQGLVSAKVAIATIRKEGDAALQVLQAGLQQAQSVGKARLTGKTLADPGKRVIAKKAPVLFDTVTLVRKDPAFAMLSEQTRDVIVRLLHKIDQDKFKAEAKASGQSMAPLLGRQEAVAAQPAAAPAPAPAEEVTAPAPAVAVAAPVVDAAAAGPELQPEPQVKAQAKKPAGKPADGKTPSKPGAKAAAKSAPKKAVASKPGAAGQSTKATKAAKSSKPSPAQP